MNKLLLISAAVLAIIGASIVAVPMFGLTDSIIGYVDTLRAGDPDLIEHHWLVLLATYFLVYTASVALCLPLAALMAVVGGLLFGVWALPVAVLSIVAGSVVPFVLSRRYAGPALAKIDSGTVVRLRRGFERNQLQCLILMRVVPWAPFTVSTVVAGALGMNLAKFLIGTALGFLPAGLAFNAIGRGVARLTDLHSMSTTQLYRDPDFLAALAGVSAVALLSFSRRIPFLARLFDRPPKSSPPQCRI